MDNNYVKVFLVIVGLYLITKVLTGLTYVSNVWF